MKKPESMAFVMDNQRVDIFFIEKIQVIPEGPLVGARVIDFQDGGVCFGENFALPLSDDGIDFFHQAFGFHAVRCDRAEQGDELIRFIRDGLTGAVGLNDHVSADVDQCGIGGRRIERGLGIVP